MGQTVLLRDPANTGAMMQVGSNTPLTGIKIQNFLFCGSSTLVRSPSAPADPCPTPAPTTCGGKLSGSGPYCVDLSVQSANTGTNPTNPFSNSGPYSVEIASTDLEDSTGDAVLSYDSVALELNVNDIYIHNSYVNSSAVTGIAIGANGGNYFDRKVCDGDANWPNDTTVFLPRNIRIENTSFANNNTGAIGAIARWVGLRNSSFSNNYINPQGGNVAGGSVFFDQCADTVNIAGNQFSAPSVTADTQGLELWGRNITVQGGNTISEYPDAGIQLNSVYNAQILGPNTINNVATGPYYGGAVLVWTAGFPGECDQVPRNTDMVTIDNNSISGPYAVLLGEYPNLFRTSTLGGLTIAGNTLSAPAVSIGPFVVESGYTGALNDAAGELTTTPRDFPVDAVSPATSRCGCGAPPPAAPPTCYATPTDTEVFTFSGAEKTGGTHITAIEGLFSPAGGADADYNGAGGVVAPVCHVLYVPSANTIYLDSTNGNGAWVGSSVLGANGSNLANASCTVLAKTSQGSVQPFNASLTLDIQFPGGSNQHMHIYERVQNDVDCTNGECQSAPSGWQYWGYIPVP